MLIKFIKLISSLVTFGVIHFYEISKWYVHICSNALVIRHNTKLSVFYGVTKILNCVRGDFFFLIRIHYILDLKKCPLHDRKWNQSNILISCHVLDRNPNYPKLNTIIDVTGASSYHGFLPVMVRNCIASLTSTSVTATNNFPQPLATALFSFLYHLASFEAGGEALVSCGMMESLLKVIQWPSTELDHITFVTRAVRVIDLITNLGKVSNTKYTYHHKLLLNYRVIFKYAKYACKCIIWIILHELNKDNQMRSPSLIWTKNS